MRKVYQTIRYSIFDQMMASPTEPLSFAKRDLQLTKMWQAMGALTQGDSPTMTDWMHLASAVDIMGAFCEAGLCDDSQGLVKECREALGEAGCRSLTTKSAIRLSGLGTMALRSLIEDYSNVLPQVSARDAIRCHRMAEKKNQTIGMR